MSRSNRLKSRLEKEEKAIGVWNEQSMENRRSRSSFTKLISLLKDIVY